jgi:hypothetical protein
MSEDEAKTKGEETSRDVTAVVPKLVSPGRVMLEKEARLSDDAQNVGVEREIGMDPVAQKRKACLPLGVSGTLVSPVLAGKRQKESNLPFEDVMLSIGDEPGGFSVRYPMQKKHVEEVAAGSSAVLEGAGEKVVESKVIKEVEVKIENEVKVKVEKVDVLLEDKKSKDYSKCGDGSAGKPYDLSEEEEVPKLPPPGVSGKGSCGEPYELSEEEEVSNQCVSGPGKGDDPIDLATADGAEDGDKKVAAVLGSSVAVSAASGRSSSNESDDSGTYMEARVNKEAVGPVARAVAEIAGVNIDSVGTADEGMEVARSASVKSRVEVPLEQLEVASLTQELESAHKQIAATHL